MESRSRATARLASTVIAGTAALAFSACSNGADPGGGHGGSAAGGGSASGAGGLGASPSGGTGTGGAIAGSSGTTGGSGGAAAAGTAGSITSGSGGSETTAGATSGGTAGATSGASGLGGAAGTGTGSGGISGGGAAGGPPIVDHFNGTDLTGWSAYRETQATSPGTLLTSQQAAQIFKPENGTIRVYGDAADLSTQARHTLVTAQSYSRYNLWLDYRWGTKVFAPYTDLTRYPRDAGVLWHLHGDRTQVWPSSIEFQIKDGTTGDIFALFARCTSLARDGGATYVPADKGGTIKVVNGATSFVQHGRSESFEVTGWNSLELSMSGGTAVYLVNGHVVNEVLAVNDKSGATGVLVTSGPIALQAEHAEVLYRNIRIQVLP